MSDSFADSVWASSVTLRGVLLEAGTWVKPSSPSRMTRIDRTETILRERFGAHWHVIDCCQRAAKEGVSARTTVRAVLAKGLSPAAADVLHEWLRSHPVATVRVSSAPSVTSRATRQSYAYWGVAYYELCIGSRGQYTLRCRRGACSTRRSVAGAERDAEATGLPITYEIGEVSVETAMEIVAESLGVPPRDVRYALSCVARERTREAIPQGTKRPSVRGATHARRVA